MVKNKITLNVLADISKRIASTTIVTPNSPSIVKTNSRALIVFNGSNIDIGDKLREIKMLKDEGVSISIAFSFMGDKIVDEEKIIDYLKPERVYKEEDILELKSIANRYSYVVAPTLTISTMSKVAGAFIDSFVSNIIWTFLYMGKEVYIDFTSTQNYLGQACNNPAIERLIGRQASAIKDLGATEIKAGNYIGTILKKISYKENLDLNVDVNLSSIGKASSSLARKDQNAKKVLTGRDIEELARDNSSITLQKGSIITPLAKDKLRSLGISVNYL